MSNITLPVWICDTCLKILAKEDSLEIVVTTDLKLTINFCVLCSYKADHYVPAHIIAPYMDDRERFIQAVVAPIKNYYGQPYVYVKDNKFWFELSDVQHNSAVEISESFYLIFLAEFNKTIMSLRKARNGQTAYIETSN